MKHTVAAGCSDLTRDQTKMAAIPQARLVAIVAIMSELEEIERKKKTEENNQAMVGSSDQQTKIRQGRFLLFSSRTARR